MAVKMRRSTSTIRYTIFGICVALCCGFVNGQTIWNGPNITFLNVDGSDPTLASSQDRMTPGVWITRGATMGIYNAAQETGFTHFLSPVDTEWADGTTANLPTSFTDWDTWSKNIHGGPPNTVGVAAVVHLKFSTVQRPTKATTGNRRAAPTWRAADGISYWNGRRPAWPRLGEGIRQTD